MPPTTRKTAEKKTAAKKATTAARSATVRKAAVPQDRRQPAAPVEPETTTVEALGRPWKVLEDARDDFELLDDFNQLETNDDPTRLPAVLRRLLGDDGYREAMDLLRDKKTGRVSIDAGTDFCLTIVRGLNPNSPSS